MKMTREDMRAGLDFAREFRGFFSREQSVEYFEGIVLYLVMRTIIIRDAWEFENDLLFNGINDTATRNTLVNERIRLEVDGLSTDRNLIPLLRWYYL